MNEKLVIEALKFLVGTEIDKVSGACRLHFSECLTDAKVLERRLEEELEVIKHKEEFQVH